MSLYFPSTFFYWKFNDARQRRAAEFQEEYNYGLEQTFREFIAEPLDLSQRARRQQTVNLAKNPLSRSNELPRRKRTGYQNQNRLNCRFWCSCRYSLSCSFTYLAIIPSSPCFPTVLA